MNNGHRLLRPFCGRHNRPESTIRAVITKFRTKFPLLDIKTSTRMCRVCIEENSSIDRKSLIHRRSQQLGMCYSTT